MGIDKPAFRKPEVESEVLDVRLGEVLRPLFDMVNHSDELLPFEQQKPIRIAEFIGSPAGLAHTAIVNIEASLREVAHEGKQDRLYAALQALVSMIEYGNRNDDA